VVKEIEGDHLNILDFPRVASISRHIEAAIEQHSRTEATVWS